MKYLVFAFAVIIASGQQAEKLLESARHKEVMGGDLKAAIAEYSKIADKFKQQPEVAAQALYRMGECQEKLGEAEARRSYERVVKEYANAGSYASQARAKLAAMGGGTAVRSGPRTRLAWDEAIDFWGRVSADGRYLSHVDWSTGDLAVKDFKTGESRRVTNYGGWDKALGEAESTSISPDGKRIIFNWLSWAPGAKESGPYQMRIINTDGSGERILRKHDADIYLEANGWSPDGKWVAVCERRTISDLERSTKIQLLAPETGEVRTVATRSTARKTHITYSPDQKWLAYSEPTLSGGSKRNVLVVPLVGTGQTETQVAENAELMGWTPAGDGLVLSKTEASGERLFFLAISAGRANGEPKPLHLPAATNATPLGITSAGELFYGTTNRTAEAFVRRIDMKSGLSKQAIWSTPVAGLGFANNWGNLRFSPDGKWLASANSLQSIRIRSIGGESERLLSVDGEMLRFEWMPDGSSLIAAVLAKEGIQKLYRIDAANGVNTFLCEIKQGRVFTPSADGNSVFNLTLSGLQLIDLASGNERSLLAIDLKDNGPMNIRRSRDGNQLILNTFHLLGVYDIRSGELRQIYKRTGEEAGDNVWVADWSADSNHVVAIVRPHQGADGGWEVKIYPAKGGEPKVQKLDGYYRDFATSPDGVHAALTKNEMHSQVWALENFLPAKK